MKWFEKIKSVLKVVGVISAVLTAVSKAIDTLMDELDKINIKGSNEVSQGSS